MTETRASRSGGSRRFHGFTPNVLVNVVGTAVPMLAALFAIPILLAGLGQSRMGLFTLALGLFGFASVFDLGIGRAITRAVAHHRGAGYPDADVASLVRKALGAVFGIGVLWGVLVYLAAGQITQFLAVRDAALQREVGDSIRVLSALVPVTLLSGALAGALEGTQSFRLVNAVRVPVGVATYLVPAAVALAVRDLQLVILSLGAVRLSGLVAWLYLAIRRLDLFAASRHGVDASDLWRYSGWLTVSNIVGPLMTTADRFYLAGIFPAAAVATYTVPLDTLYRVTAFPSAALNVAFPAIAQPENRHETLDRILSLAMPGAAILWGLPLAIAGVFADKLISAWLGAGFAREALEISRWLIVGVMVNGIALIPFTILQADGRVAMTARFHLLELAPYVVALVLFTSAWGVPGAAVAWTLRVSLDSVLLLWAVGSRYRGLRRKLVSLAMVPACGGGLVLASAMWPQATALFAAIAMLVAASSASVMWRRAAAPSSPLK